MARILAATRLARANACYRSRSPFDSLSGPQVARAARTGREGQGEVGPMICAQHQKHFPRRCRGDTCAPASRQVSPRRPPQPGADSSVCFGCNRYRIRCKDYADAPAHSACANLARPLYKLRLSPKPDLVASLLAIGERLQRSPLKTTAGRACVPVGSRLSAARFARRERLTSSPFTLISLRAAIIPEKTSRSFTYRQGGCRPRLPPRLASFCPFR